jgi:hypothetical protein
MKNLTSQPVEILQTLGSKKRRTGFLGFMVGDFEGARNYTLV